MQVTSYKLRVTRPSPRPLRQRSVAGAARPGFSLIELILYVAVLSILLVGIIDISLIIRQQHVKFSFLRRVYTDLNMALNNVDFLVKSSDGFATDNSGPCLDFNGSQSPSTYYLSLYFDTSSSATILPAECRGKGSATASTTAVKIYWSSANHLWLDCYRAFIKDKSGNCTTIQGSGNASFWLTSDKNTIVYENGLQFSTTTAAGNMSLETSLTIGSAPTGGIGFYSATTTASSTAAFRIKIANENQPTQSVCGDGSRQGSEVCDSTLTTQCVSQPTYYRGGYVEDGATCSGKWACNNTCTACITQASC